MPSKNLLNINPDVLFQEHSVSEIDDTQKKLLSEIERKREELRIMVGERYRDLIEAADTIEQMGSTVQKCIKHIENMTDTCKNLHDTHLIGFKTEALPTNVHRPIASYQMHGVAIQLKILMCMPEQIWSNIDVEDFLTAMQLFIFSRHIYTGLQLEAGNKNVSQLMPVVQRQWNSLSNFHSLLLEACQHKLGNPDIKADVAASCLASLFLLDNKQSLVDLMNTFIVLHSTNSLTQILTADVEENIKQGNVKDDIKNRITTSVKVILRTVELIYSCFVENEEGLILQRLNTLFRKDAPPLINLVQYRGSMSLQLLPPIVSNYRLTTPVQLRTVSQSELSNCVSSWMRWVQKFSADRVESLLRFVKTAKSLQQIREEATQIETPKNWDVICRSLSIDQKHSNMWVSHFQPLLTKRVQDIIASKWADIGKNLKETINKLLTKVALPGCREKESNLNWFVWNDLIGQTHVDSKEDIIKSINTLMKGMTMQDRGFTPNLESLCETFNSSLGCLLEDLNIYLYGTSNGAVGTSSDPVGGQPTQFESDVKHLLLESADSLEQSKTSKYLDRNTIEDFLRQCSRNNLDIIIHFIHNDCIATKNSDNLKKTSAILTARFFQALPQLVSNLRLCFVPPPIHVPGSIFEDVHTKDMAATNCWEDVCKVLNNSCNTCWETWIDITIKRVDNLLKDMPQEFTTVANMDYLLVQWDNITIEEKDDQDQPIKSTIKIPAGPSVKLQKFLYSISRMLDEVVPHTLPKKTHSTFIERVAEKTLEYFLTVVKEKGDQINQKCALQLLMDVRHLTLLTVTRENKKSLSDSHEVCDLLKQKIDPFDYDVFYPRLQVNTKRSVQRVQTLLGSIVANHDQLSSIIGSKPLTSGGTADKEPNTYILAGQGNSNAAWFSLLPITAPTSRRSDEKQRKKQTSSMIQSKIGNVTSESPMGSSSSNTSNIRSGAAAFFGSMTSDWFGS